MHIKGNEPLKLSDHAHEEEYQILKKKSLAVNKFLKNPHTSPFKDLGVTVTAQAEVRLKIIFHMYPHNWHRETLDHV